MRHGTNRIGRELSSYTLGILLAIGIVVLMAATAFGQSKSGPKPPHHPSDSKKPASGKAAPRKVELRRVVVITHGANEQAIRQAFQVTSDFNFKEVPLDKVIQRFKELTRQKILLDNKALSDVGIALDSPVTFAAQGISAKSAMAIILHNLSLTWIILDEVVLITTPEEADNQLTTKVYPVYDLIAPKPSYRFQGIYIPGMTTGGFPRTLPSAATPFTGNLGGMGADTGEGMGGGMFSVPENLQPSKVNDRVGDTFLAQMGGAAKSQPHRSKGSPGGQQEGAGTGGMMPPSPRPAELAFTMDDLIEVMTSTIKPTSWDGVGGPGSIMPAAGMLVVSQTQDVHEEIEALLTNLRAVSPGLRVVNIRAVWLQLDLKQLHQLLHSKPGKEGGIGRKALYEMAGKTKGYLGAITCLSGQTVHIASGRSRTAIIGATPVVGDEVGYQPATGNPLSGALLQVTPQLLPNTQGAMLDLCSSVTRAVDKPETIRFYSDDPHATKKNAEKTPMRGITLDRVNMVVSQLATSLKVPLGEPTLVGGLTSETPDGDEQAADAPQLYLFIEASAK